MLKKQQKKKTKKKTSTIKKKPVQVNHSKKKLNPFLKIGIVVLVVLGIVYLIGYFSLSKQFLGQVTINGVDVSWKTQAQAKELVSDKTVSQTLTLVFNDGETEEIQASDCGVAVDIDQMLSDEFNKQDHRLWFLYAFKITNRSNYDLISIDEEKTSEALSKLTHMSDDAQEEPVNAKLVYKDKKFSIKEEDLGSTIDEEKLIEEIHVAFSSFESEIDLTEKECYVLPEVTSDNEKLNAKLDAANKYAAVEITYQTDSGTTYSLTGKDIVKWLTYDKESGTYKKDDDTFKEKAKEFLNSIAGSFKQTVSSHTFTGAGGKKHTVSGGNMYEAMDVTAETENLLSDIENLKSGTREPDLTGGTEKATNGGLGDTFVEVDLGDQIVYYHENGEVTMQSDCVSGLASDSERKTPAGCYYIYFMDKDRILRGTKLPNGEYPYESHVDYWMAFNGGIGLHDADWRSSFGGSIYLTNGSHGCVNLPTSFAGKLYNKLTIGTPVVCYY